MLYIYIYRRKNRNHKFFQEVEYFNAKLRASECCTRNQYNTIMDWIPGTVFSTVLIHSFMKPISIAHQETISCFSLTFIPMCLFRPPNAWKVPTSNSQHCVLMASFVPFSFLGRVIAGRVSSTWTFSDEVLPIAGPLGHSGSRRR